MTDDIDLSTVDIICPVCKETIGTLIDKNFSEKISKHNRKHIS